MANEQDIMREKYGLPKLPHMSATVEECYCKDDDCAGWQLEVYQLDVDGRLTAKFAGVTFHLTQEAAELEAAKINGRSKRLGKSNAGTETGLEGVQTEGEDDMQTQTQAFQPQSGKPLSNKRKVFNAFIAGETDRKKLNKLTKNSIQDNVLRGWCAGWLRGSDPGYPKLSRATKQLIEKNRAQ